MCLLHHCQLMPALNSKKLNMRYIHSIEKKKEKKSIYKKPYLITIHITGQIFQHFFHVGTNHLDDSFFHHWVADINSKENCGCLRFHTFPTIIFCGCSFVCAQAKFSSLVMINTFTSVIQMLEVFSWNFGSCFAKRTLKSSTYK